MNLKLNHKNNYFCFFVCAICFLTNMSQMPYLVENGMTRFLSVPIWLLFGSVCLLKSGRLYIERIKSFFVITLFFALYYIISAIFNVDFLDSALPYPIFLSVFVLCVGLMAGSYLDLDDVQQIVTSYIWSGTIVCADVYFTYIYGNVLDEETYLYASKNSVSQILLTTWILILLFKFNSNKWWQKIVYAMSFVFLAWTLISLKSRATIIAIPVVMLWIVINGKFNKKARTLISVLLIVLLAVLLFNEDFYDLLIYDVLFRGKDADNLNAITSGRSDEWGTFFIDWKQNFFFGVGRNKRESLILTAFLEYGLFGGFLILLLAIYPLVWGIFKVDKENPIYLAFTSIALIYVINAVFEQLAPFGPGVKCYFLWFLFGILASKKKLEHIPPIALRKKYFKEKSYE